MNDPQKKYRLGTASKNILLEGTIKDHKQKQRSRPFPAGDHKAAMNRNESMINTRYK